MMGLVEFALLLAAVMMLAPAAVFFLEICASFAPLRLQPRETGGYPRTVFVVPAHNESKNIIPTLRDLKTAQWAGANILVVADNCDDDTAMIAEGEDVQVIERRDPERRGKGYALQHAIEQLRKDPPDCVVFFDADCRVPQSLPRQIAKLAIERVRPVQAGYKMIAPEGAGPRLAIAEFAWMLINQVRMSGLYRLVKITRFTGVGLALPWPIARDLQLASADITEDLTMTFALARARKAPMFFSELFVTSVFPDRADDSVTQRARWEHGSLDVLRRHALPGLVEGAKTGNLQLLMLSLDALIPPITVFGALLVALAAITAAFAISGRFEPFLLTLIACALFACSLAMAWFRYGRDVLPISKLMGLAPYLLEKLRIYGQRGRQSSRTWTRTGRGDE